MGTEVIDRRHVRKYPRITISFPVEYSVGDKTFHERASTLGGGGLFLSLQDPPPVGSEVKMRFRPARRLPIIEARARVRYIEPARGAAFEFVEIAPEHRRHLLRLIHNKLGDKRRQQRAVITAQVECDRCVSLAFARNVSIGGMFIETKDPMPVGARLMLRFNLGDDAPTVEVAAEVTYEVVKLGMGVQFVAIAETDRKRIEAFVKRAQEGALPAAASPSS